MHAFQGNEKYEPLLSAKVFLISEIACRVNRMIMEKVLECLRRIKVKIQFLYFG